MTEKLVYRIPEAAKALGMSVRTLWRRISNKEIAAVRDNGRVLVPADALHSYLRSLPDATKRAQS